MNFDLSKNLNELENVNWGEPTYSSSLVKKCHELRYKRLADFEIEDLRIMIGQQISNVYLIPLAINKLKENPLAEGDFYEGDLLQNVLNITLAYWKENAELATELLAISDCALLLLPQSDNNEKTIQLIEESIDHFRQIIL